MTVADKLDRLIEQLDIVIQRLGATTASSCEVKTSTRGTDITVKAYAGSPAEPAVDDAMAEYIRAFREIERQLMGRVA